MVRAEFTNATKYEIVVREGTEGAYQFYTKIASNRSHTVNYGSSESDTYREFLCILESNDGQRVLGETMITPLDIVNNKDFKFELNENGKLQVIKTLRTAKSTGVISELTDDNIAKAVKGFTQWLGSKVSVGQKKPLEPESPALSRTESGSSVQATADSSSAQGAAPETPQSTAQPSVTSQETAQPSVTSQETAQPSVTSQETAQPSVTSQETAQPSVTSELL